MFNKQIISLLGSKWALMCYACLAVMEMFSASSSLWLVMIMDRITDNQPFTEFLLLYIGSLLLPSIPWCFAFVFLTSWRQEAQRSFIKSFVASNKSNISEWNNKNVREQKMSILTTEGPSTLSLVIDYAFDVFSYSVSILFNILALSIVVEPLFSVAFGISLTLVAAILKLRRRKQRQLTRKALNARIDLTQSLREAWDNVLLGNNYNFKIWEEKTNQRINRCLKKNVELERFDQLLAIIVSLITMVPSLLVVLYFCYSNQNDSAKLASFFVTIPILFLILSYTYQTLSKIFRWGMHKNKLITIFKAIEPVQTTPEEILKKINWPKINYSINETLSHKLHLEGPSSLQRPIFLTSHEDLLTQFNLNGKKIKPGRITLRGENGAGKSSTLIFLKNNLNDKAFILPATGHLNFSVDTNNLSTGENLKNKLIEILNKVSAEILLLDEWDANLDAENREHLSKLIDQISEKKCIIEVRHR